MTEILISCVYRGQINILDSCCVFPQGQSVHTNLGTVCPCRSRGSVLTKARVSLQMKRKRSHKGQRVLAEGRMFLQKYRVFLNSDSVFSQGQCLPAEGESVFAVG